LLHSMTMSKSIRLPLKNRERRLMDIIALRCDFPIYRISGLLLNMELKGWWSRCQEIIWGDIIKSAFLYL
jgi:hypothetical protein